MPFHHRVIFCERPIYPYFDCFFLLTSFFCHFAPMILYFSKNTP